MGADKMRLKQVTLVVFLAALPTPALAYLDGGTISMALQLIAGGIGLGLLFMRQWLNALLSFFKGKEPEAKKGEAQDQSKE